MGFAASCSSSSSECCQFPGVSDVQARLRICMIGGPFLARATEVLAMGSDSSDDDWRALIELTGGTGIQTGGGFPVHL